MGAPWTMPNWLKQYVPHMQDTGEGVEKVMTDEFKAVVAEMQGTSEGRALSVNGQIGLLVALRAAGLLKEVLPCPASSK